MAAILKFALSRELA